MTPLLSLHRTARRCAAVCLVFATLPAFLPAAAGTAAISPASFTRGQAITIQYNATGGPLAGASPVLVHYGFNGWTGVPPSDPAMTSAGANQWTYSLTMPTGKSQIDLAFRNNAGSTWDNNGGADFHFTIDLSGYDLGSTVVPAAQGGGVVFRVWAPNATSSLVRGEFNAYDTSGIMTKDVASGIWSRFVANATEGQKYKYYFNGASWKKDPRARRVNNSNGDSIIYNPGAYAWGADTHAQPTTDTLVIYELHIGTFDAGADNTAPGLFSDAISRLDYLEALGVNAVEVLPVTEFPGALSGGYNPSDPYAIETDYGSADGFKDFVKACHQRNMDVFVDVVHNHYGPGDLDIYGFDGAEAPSGIYFYDSPADLATTIYGPRPDYSVTQVRNYIEDNTRLYLDEYHADGFRWDFTKAMRGTLDASFNLVAPIPEGISLLRESNNIIHSQPGVFSIAEDHAGDSNITTPTTNPSGYGFDSQWAVDFCVTIDDQLAQSSDASRSMATIAGKIAGDITRVHYLESHDEVWQSNGKDRLATRIDGTDPTSYRARKMSAMGAALLFASPGIPLLFQGQEWLEADRWSENTGMDWTKYTTTPYNKSVALYTDLIHLRRNLTNTARGLSGDTTNIYLTLEPQKVIAWERKASGSQPGDDIVCLANFSNVSYSSFTIGFPQPGTWYEIFSSDRTAYGADYTNVGASQTLTTVANPMHGFNQRGDVAIGPYSVVILSQANPAIATIQGWRDMEP